MIAILWDCKYILILIILKSYDAIHGSKILKIMPFDDDKNLSFFNKLNPIFDI